MIFTSFNLIELLFNRTNLVEFSGSPSRLTRMLCVGYTPRAWHRSFWLMLVVGWGLLWTSNIITVMRASVPRAKECCVPRAKECCVPVLQRVACQCYSVLRASVTACCVPVLQRVACHFYISAIIASCLASLQLPVRWYAWSRFVSQTAEAHLVWSKTQT